MVYPNAGGRFPVTEADCHDVQAHLLGRFGPHRPAFAMLGGGIDAQRLARHRPRFSPDTIFLVGGALYRGGRIRERAAELLQLVERP